MRVTVGLVSLLMSVVSMTALGGCAGYSFAGRAMAETPVLLDVESHAQEPGLALVARRALTTALEPSLSVADSADGSLPLRVIVTVVDVTDRPAAIARVDGNVGATYYEVNAALRAELYEGADLIATNDVVGRAKYQDATLPLWTDDGRQDAVARAIADACKQEADWLFAVVVPALEPL